MYAQYIRNCKKIHSKRKSQKKMISLIETFQQNKNSVYVRAVLEDMVQVYPSTLYDPPEYGPALCESSFIFDEDEILPENEEELIDYLDGLDLDWKIVDTSDCSFGFVD